MSLEQTNLSGITELNDNELLCVSGGSEKKEEEEKTAREKFLEKLKEITDELNRLIILSGGGGDDKPVSP